MSDQGEWLLEIEGLKTYFHTDEGVAKAVDGVSYAIRPGETLGVVGESGSGKSVTALSILQLLPMPPGRFEGGSIRFRGEELIGAEEERLREIRGNDIAMIFQEPMTALNPVFTVKPDRETVKLHQGLDDEARARAIEMLTKVGIPAPEKRVDEYPHQPAGRHASARDDRHGHGLRPGAPDRRRADHGAPRRSRRRSSTSSRSCRRRRG